MNKTYISITITYWNGSTLAPSVHYYRNDGVHPYVSTFDKLTVDEANQLMWTLVKLGGKNAYTSNWYDNTICSSNVTYWGEL